ncbi:MAG: hypothetical protein ACREJT_18210, partial [Myxococcota bacterium]
MACYPDMRLTGWYVGTEDPRRGDMRGDCTITGPQHGSEPALVQRGRDQCRAVHTWEQPHELAPVTRSSQGWCT